MGTRTATGLGHGQYWGKPGVARQVSGILGTGPVDLPSITRPGVEFDIAEPPRYRVVAKRPTEPRTECLVPERGDDTFTDTSG